MRYKEVGIEPVDVGIRHRLGAVLGLDELERADEVLLDMIENREQYVDEIRCARDEFIYEFGNSSKVGG